MGGLEEIIRQIQSDASDEAQEIAQNAKNTCNSIEQEAANKISEIEKLGRETAQKEGSRTFEKIKSAATMQAKQDYLRAKQEMISDIIQKAYQKMENAPTEQYFSYLITIAEAYAQAKSGQLCLNEKDLARMPQDFATKIKEIATQNGGTLEISTTPVDIQNGMILDYGEIEENCTFEALFHNKKEQIQDMLNAYLFES